MESEYDIRVIDIKPDVVKNYAEILTFGNRNMNKKWTFKNDDILNYKGDAIVSPANSKGHMDGGIDKDYIDYFGEGLQNRVHTFIKRDFDGFMPVGTAIIIPTYNKIIPLMIMAPTMEEPKPINNALDIYYAARGIFHAIDNHNNFSRNKHKKTIESILMPGLGTGAGALHPIESANMIKQAFIDHQDRKPYKFDNWLSAKSAYKFL